jgi:hypothetical protein
LDSKNKTNAVFITDGYANQNLEMRFVSKEELAVKAPQQRVIISRENAFFETKFHAVLYGRNPKLKDYLLDILLHGQEVMTR